MNKPSLHLAQRQELSMTTELREAIELLQLSSLELTNLIATELADNPLLERESTDDDWGTADDGSKEGDWDDTYAAVSDAGLDGPLGTASHGSPAGNDETGWEATAHSAQTLHQHLLAQLHHATGSTLLHKAGAYLIDALDDAGYLRTTMAEAAAALNLPESVVDDARALLQTLDPIGVAARDLAECLRLQLHKADNLTPAAEACLMHLDKVAARDLAFLAKAGRCSMQDVAESIMDIRACNPRPASAFKPPHGAPPTAHAVPDVIVQPDGHGGFTVELNGHAFPRLLIHPPMKIEAKGPKVSAQLQQAKQYQTERHGRAKWLVGALEQRATSILKIAKAIVSAQTQFLEAGAEFMTPLTLREIAERVGVHESTVSRVTTGKYMQTPCGVMEFKTFFASGVASTGGQVAVASRSVQAIIQRLVNAENPSKPLSDQALVQMLQAEGVEVARRTIAKYRGILNIPGTAERKVRATTRA
ncbi:MAG: RNA polymerase factor sigma-54 [Alphaproteobacteria bacterium]